MKITLKLFASLTEYLPLPSRIGNQIELVVQPSATISQVIQPFGLPDKQVHLVLVNGKYIAPADRALYPLKADDVLAIWPPIAGG
jgi:molybdopterin converting factor small subunit